jgi:hypothetical protein
MRRGSSRALLLAAIAATLAPASAAGQRAVGAHARPVTCHSGRTLFAAPGGIRAFVIVRRFDAGHADASSFKDFYVCRPGSSTPRIISHGEPYSFESASGFRLFGQRLGFLIYSAGVQSGSQAEFGWIDLRIGRVRTAVINASEGLEDSEEEEPGLARIPDGRVRYAIAEDGTVALAGEGGFPVEWEVCVLPVGLHALGPAHALYTAPEHGEGIDLDSIKISQSSVSWRTKKGQPVSAAR